MTVDPKSKSRGITDGWDHAPARAMLRACGFNDEDLSKPLVGIANTWTEVTPCNYHLRDLAEKVKEGVRSAGGTPPSTPFALPARRSGCPGDPRILRRPPFPFALPTYVAML